MDLDYNTAIGDIVRHTYQCSGYVMPEDDDFFDEIINSDEDARLIVRRFKEYGFGTYEDNSFSLSPIGILLHEKYDCDVERFIRADQTKTKAERLVHIYSIIGIVLSVAISIVSLIVSVFD